MIPKRLLCRFPTFGNVGHVHVNADSCTNVQRLEFKRRRKEFISIITVITLQQKPSSKAYASE